MVVRKVKYWVYKKTETKQAIEMQRYSNQADKVFVNNLSNRDSTGYSTVMTLWFWGRFKRRLDSPGTRRRKQKETNISTNCCQKGEIINYDDCKKYWWVLNYCFFFLGRGLWSTALKGLMVKRCAMAAPAWARATFWFMTFNYQEALMHFFRF